MPSSGGFDGSSSSGKRVLHPALERVIRLDTVGVAAPDRDSKGKARVADIAPSDSSASSLPRPAMHASVS